MNVEIAEPDYERGIREQAEINRRVRFIVATLHDLVEQDQDDKQPFDFCDGAGKSLQFRGFEAGCGDASPARNIVFQMLLRIVYAFLIG